MHRYYAEGYKQKVRCNLSKQILPCSLFTVRQFPSSYLCSKVLQESMLIQHVQKTGTFILGI